MTLDHLHAPAASRSRDGSATGPTVVPLSAAQRSIWFAQQLSPQTPLAIAHYVDLRGPLDTGLLSEAGRRVSHEFGSTMVRFEAADDPAEPPVQVLDDTANDRMEHHDFRDRRDPEADALAWMDADFLRPLDLFTDRLIESVTLRIADDRWFWYSRVHHILMDGYGAATYTDRMAQVYTALAAGQPVPPARSGGPVELHRDDEAYRASTRFERDRAHWAERLPDLPEPLTLTDPVGTIGRTRTAGGLLDRCLQDDVDAFCAATGVTVAAAVSAAAALYVSRMTGTDDVVLSLPVTARTNALLRRSGGMVSNVLPVRAGLAGQPTVAELAAQITTELSGALRHQRFRFEDMLRSSGRRPGGRGFFGPVVNMMLFRRQTVLGDAVGESKILSTGPVDDLAFTVYTGSGRLRIDLEANSAAYSAEVLHSHHRRFLGVLAALVRADPQTRVADLRVLPYGDRLRRVPARGPEAAEPLPLPTLLASVAAAHPEAVALVADETDLRYDELWHRVNRLARLLIERGVGPGRIVAVVLPRGTACAISELAVLAAGGAFVPIDPALPDERIEYLLDDSRALLGITAATGRDLPAAAAVLPWLNLDEPALRAAFAAADSRPVTDADRIRPLTVDDPAYLIYTSGSTGRPKGVLVGHRGLASFVREQNRTYGAGPGSRTLHFASPSFDASILELLLALGAGATLVVVPTTVYGGAELAHILRAEQITHAFLTPAALASISPDGLDGLHTVIVGGEACPRELVARWAGGRRMFNAYGPTEATVMATLAGPLSPTGPVTIGAPVCGATAVILDHRLRPMPTGATGELYLGGPGLALAYHRRSALTADRFVADPFGPPGARLYRTGDLVRWGIDGRLEYRGRADHQVKIRGFRIELGEIDSAMAAVDGVEFAAAEPRRTAGGSTALVGYYTGTADAETLRQALVAVLPAHEVPTAFVRLETVPLTSSGKLDRAALPEPAVQTAPYRRPASAAEEAVAGAFAAATGVQRVGRDDDFFSLGGDSLSATAMTAALGEAVGADVPVRWIFETPTVSALAARLGDAGRRRLPVLAARDSGDPDSGAPDTPVPVSPQQRRMWIINQFDERSALFNIPLALRLRGPLDVPALQTALRDLITRQETLRTVYPEGPDGPVQQVLDVDDALAAVDYRVEDCAPGRLEQRLTELAAVSFDVASAVPLAVTLLRLAPDEHVLVCVVHHIAADGSSTAPMANDLATAYAARRAGRAPDWAPLPVSYRDYTLWHRQVMGAETDADSVLSGQLAYWRERLTGLPELLALPTDRTRPAVAGSRGGELHAVLPGALVHRMRAAAAESGATPFMLSHASLALLLSRITGATDIAVGTPVAGRGHPGLAALVGMFVGTVVLRTDVDPARPFGDLLAAVRENDLRDLENADVPFDRLVDLLAPRRSAAYHPLFQVGFSYQNLPPSRLGLDGLEATVLHTSLGVAKSDLHLTLTEAGDELTVQWDYDADLFDHGTVERWHDLWTSLLTAALDQPASPVGGLAAGTDGAILSGTASDRAPATLTGLLTAAAAAHPDRPALAADHGPDHSYRDLFGRARQLAQRLRDRGVGPEVPVAVAIPRSVELIDAVLAVLLAGGAYVPVDPAAPAQRTALVLESSGAALVLVAGPTPAAVGAAGLPVLDVTAPGPAGAEPAAFAETAPLSAENTAYVIYTSGSTGTPKGVAVSHRAIAAQLQWKAAAYPLEPGESTVLKTPLTFDLSVWELFWPLISGARLVLAEADGHRDPRYLAGLLRRAGAVAAHFVPSLLDAQLDAAADTGLEPHRLRWALCIGEALTPALAARATEQLAARVHNLYGPTEAAVGITAHEWRPDDGAAAGVPIGVPVDDSHTLVLDARLHPVPLGSVGELYLGGVQLATAYHRRPDLTATRFVADPAGGGSRLYRTGDLARLRPDGALEFLGRNDFQVKIRGQRIELGEIEAVLAADPRVGAAAVTAADDNLIAYLVPASSSAGDGPLDVTAVLDTARTALPGYMVPVAGLVLTELPRGLHGKVDRTALPAAPLPSRRYVPARSRIERVLVGLLGDLLGTDHAGGVDRIGVDDDFFALGGNSLLAARLAARIGDELGVDVPVREIFEAPRVADLARRLETAKNLGRPALTAADRPTVIPLSRAQQRMWLLERIDPGSALYNLPFALDVTGPLDLAALRGSVRALLQRHEVLRTSYPDRLGVPQQHIHSVDEALELIELDFSGRGTVAGFAGRGFALGTGLPLRVAVIEDGPDRHTVVVVVHHIAADGWSARLLLRDLLAGYAGTGQAQPPQLQYADFALWQQRLLPELTGQRAFWRTTLAGLPGPLPLPTDRRRAPDAGHAGDTVHRVLDGEVAAALQALGRTHGASLFHVVHTGLALLLSRLTGLTDVVIGTPVSGRASRLLDDVVGMFVETAVLRTRIDPDATVAELVDAVAAADLAAQANAEYPFDAIADEFEADRAGGHHPIFQTMLAFGDPPPSTVELGPLTAAPVEIDLPVARFDLHVTVDVPLDAAGADGPMRIRWTYATALFDRATVEGFAARFERLLTAIAARPEQRVDRLALLDPAELHTLTGRFSGADAIGPPPSADTLPELLAAAPRRDAEFTARVARTARALIAAGAGPETAVAIAVDRSTDMLVAVHAAVAAGAAYVPIDRTQPAARIEAMLETVDPVAVIADDAGREALPPGRRAQVVPAAELHPDRPGHPVTDRDRRTPLRPDHPAYILFTSGSTGVPKAVSVSHRAIVQRLEWMSERTPLTATDVVLQKTPITFDVSVWELFWPLAVGARLVIAPPGAHRDPLELADLIDAEQVSVIHFVPAMLDAFLAAGIEPGRLASLRLVFTSGEALSAGTAAALLAGTRAHLHNLYGPTEAAVDVTAVQVTTGSAATGTISIGRPVPCSTVYVLDHRLTPVPPGVTGELYLGGRQLARGYHGRPDLTAGRFIASPFAAGERLYRTGDLVRWQRGNTAEPELEYLGRSDFQIKIRGQRVELGEIEAVLAQQPQVHAAAVIHHDDPRTGPRLIGYAAVGPDGVAADLPAVLRAALARRLPEHMVPAQIVLTDRLPVTANGKVDRTALTAPPAPAAGGTGRAARTPNEELVLTLIREILGDTVGVDDDFFEVGGNSLIATRLVAGIAAATGTRVPVRAVFDGRTAEALAARLDETGDDHTGESVTGDDQAGPATLPPRPGVLPLAPAQLPLWLANRKSPDSVAQWILAPVRLPGRVDVAVLTAAVGDVLTRHEVLRTRYPEGVDGPRQDILPAERTDPAALVSEHPDAAAAALSLTVDLTAELPLRILVQDDGDHTVLVLAVHHIAADGWSLPVLAADVQRAYRARAAEEEPDWAPLPLQYADHVLARAARLGDPADPDSPGARARQYWHTVLAGAPQQPGFRSAPRPDADPDRPQARVYRRTLTAAQSAPITALTGRTRSTLFAVLHAALAITLSRNGSGTDLIIGTPLAGRTDPAVADLVGMFVTMAPLRTRVRPGQSFAAAVDESTTCILDALDHGDLDVGELADHPLIHVSLTVDDQAAHPAALPVDVPAARFDLEFAVTATADGGLELTAAHRGEIYRPQTAARLLDRWQRVLEQAAAGPERAVAGLDLLLPAERRELSGLTGPAAPPVRLLADILDTPGWRLSGLDETTFAARSAQLARLLIAAGIGPGSVVALCLPRSSWSVIAMRAVAATGAAFVPIDPAHPAQRRTFMARDSGAALILTVDAERGGLTDLPADLAGGAIVLDDPAVTAQLAALPDGAVHDAERTLPARPDQTAYLIYTSGSTGRPKAVTVTHRGLAAFAAEQRRYRVTGTSRVLHFASPSFDAALLELLLAADAGATTVIACPQLYGGTELAEVLAAEAVTHAFLTPAVLGTLTAGDPDLPGTVIVGGDACPPAVAADWIAHGARFFNAYGPTEATVMGTLAGPLTDDGPAAALPIGTAITGVTARVLDEHLLECPPGVPGELYLSGPGLARGYHGRPDLTAGAFVADPHGPPGSRCYRTGDLVRAVAAADGAVHLVHLGRVDHQIKIRGHRIETGEVEAALRALPGITAAAVTGRTAADGTTVLAGYVTADEPTTPAQIQASLRAELPAYAVPSAIMVVDALPLTVSGKVDLRALPEPQVQRAGYRAPASGSETLIAGIFAEILGLDRVGVDDDFFAAGGHSLSATRAVARIRAESGRELTVRQLFETPTIAGLAAALDDSAASGGPVLGSLPHPEHIPLSPVQRRMWFLNRLDSSALTENIPVLLRLRGTLDVDAFSAALHDLTVRHEVLRTVYPDTADGPHQLVLTAEQAAPGLAVHAVRVAPSDPAVQAVLHRGFDVTTAPPVRAALWVDPDGHDHLFALVLHHICADGLSMTILARDLAQAYAARTSGRAPEFTAPAVGYTDFALWQRAVLDREGGAQLRRRLRALDGAPPLVDLPTDRPRPPQPSAIGDRVEFTVDPGLHGALQETAARHGGTPFMLAHTALAVLLGRIGDNRDVVIGTPIAGRDEAGLHEVVGMFVNMLALRTRIAPSDSGSRALAVAREAALSAFADAAVPFDRIVEDLDVPRGTGAHPVFQVAFSFQNLGPLTAALPGLDARIVDDETTVAEFDLHLTLAEGEPGAGLTGRLDYATELFDRSTAEALSAQYLRVLRALVERPECPVGDLPLLDSDDYRRLTVTAPSPALVRGGLADEFHRQARRTPDAVAVVDGEQSLTYREFAQTVLALARTLERRGLGPEDRIAVTTPRSLAQLVALYAIATVGAAYVPVDLTAGERAEAILASAQPAATLATGDIPVRPPATGDDAADFLGRARPQHPAYVLFTSGSTGLPKGVSVPNEAVGEQLRWMQERFALTADDAVLVRTSAGFDLSVWEYWWALQTGARVVLAAPGLERDGPGLLRTLSEQHITVLPTVPSALTMLLDAGDLPDGLRALLCIGEELPVSLAHRLTRNGGPARLHNLYGPTETAVSVTDHRVEAPVPHRIPIGLPQTSVTVRVLDERLRPVPDGVPGELHLGGIQLARGYHADPARTAAAFVADPYRRGARLYRTGDLVRRSRDGVLTYLGRTDDQLKVRGFRVEPGEIEAVLRRSEGVTDAAVAAFGDRLVAFLTGPDPDPDTIAAALATRLPGYLRPELQIVDALPHNANGKIDRSRLPEPARRERRHIPPRTPLERTVTGIVAEVTGADRAGLADGFFDLGGNSLSATRLSARLEAELHRPVPVRLIFDTADLAGLAAAIEASDDGPSSGPRLVRREKAGPAPLAPAQRRIWAAVEAGRSADWNVPVALRLRGDLNPEVLAATLADVLAAHPALRTRYRRGPHGPQLHVDPAGTAAARISGSLQPQPVGEARLGEVIGAIAWQALDLADDGPLRVRLLALDPQTTVLVVVVHHLSADGASMPVLLRDLLAALAARLHGREPALAAQPIRFTDYSSWRHEVLGPPEAPTDEGRRQLDYWQRTLGRPERSAPAGRPAWDSAGATVAFDLDAQLHRRLESVAGGASTGLFPVLQAAFAVVLAARNGSSRVRVGTANANRPHIHLDEVVGNFAEDIPMLLDVTGERSFGELVAQVNEQLLGGLAHPDVSGPDLLAAFGLSADPAEPAGGPFFPATLIVQQSAVGAGADDEIDLGGLTVRREPIANTVAKHELEIAVLDQRRDGEPAGLHGTLVYPTVELSPAQAGRVVAGLQQILHSVAAGTGVSIAELLEALP